MIKIAIATINDFDNVIRLSERLYNFDEQKQLPSNFEKIRENIKVALLNKKVLKALNNDLIVGYILLEETPSSKWVKNSIFLSELYVIPELRKKGIGTNLVETVLKYKFPAIYKSIWLTHSTEEEDLTIFYNKFGFKVIGNTDVGNIIMVKLLTTANES